MVRTVLVTRPAGQADRLCELLSKAGYRALHQPMLDIVEHQVLQPAQRQQLLDLDQYQHIVFISANAVRCGMSWIEQFWPQFPAAVSWYAVGDSSARLLLDYGITAIKPARRMDSDGLLALDGLRQVGGQKILIVKGEGGRPTLEDRLLQRGARVDLLEVYQRQAPNLDAECLPALFTDYNFFAVLISSAEGLNNMLELLGHEALKLIGDCCMIVPGERLRTQAESAGIQRLVVALNATDQSMLDALAGC